jgi:hypothetical protein
VQTKVYVARPLEFQHSHVQQPGQYIWPTMTQVHAWTKKIVGASSIFWQQTVKFFFHLQTERQWKGL